MTLKQTQKKEVCLGSGSNFKNISKKLHGLYIWVISEIFQVILKKNHMKYGAIKDTFWKSGLGSIKQIYGSDHTNS